MNLGIMQPYFFPYIGYFQLINAVEFIDGVPQVDHGEKGNHHHRHQHHKSNGLVANLKDHPDQQKKAQKKTNDNPGKRL